MTTTNNEAQELLNSRVAVYGERVENMTRVAKVFSGILGIEVRPDQVPLLMVGYKTVRASQTPDYEDNVKDIEGYAIMFREIIGDDMIPAVNTDEYLAEKNRRAMKSFERPAVPTFLCRGCGWTLPEMALPSAHAEDCEVAELNRNVNAYNGRYSDEPLPQPTVEQATRLQKEVPSFQPGPPEQLVNRPHLAVYRQQLTDIFRRTWAEQETYRPADKYAEAAAHEAVEYFWTTFLRNEQLEAGVKEFPAL